MTTIVTPAATAQNVISVQRGEFADRKVGTTAIKTSNTKYISFKLHSPSFYLTPRKSLSEAMHKQCRLWPGQRLSKLRVNAQGEEVQSIVREPLRGQFRFQDLDTFVTHTFFVCLLNEESANPKRNRTNPNHHKPILMEPKKFKWIWSHLIKITFEKNKRIINCNAKMFISLYNYFVCHNYWKISPKLMDRGTSSSTDFASELDQRRISFWGKQ